MQKKLLRKKAFCYPNPAGLWLFVASFCVFTSLFAEIIPVGSQQIPDSIITGDERSSGGRVEIYLKSNARELVHLREITWQGASGDEHAAPPDYQLIWFRCQPQEIAPGMEAVLTLSLRNALVKPCEFILLWSDQTTTKVRVSPFPSPFRIGGITFTKDYKRAIVYVEQIRIGRRPPESIWINGERYSGKNLQWLASDYTAGVRPAIITHPQSFQQGAPYVFRLADDRDAAGVSIRAFHGWTRAGTCGYQEFSRFAQAGINQYFSFAPLSRKQLDEMAALGLAAYSVFPKDGILPEGTENHAALLAWVVADEPDVHDASAGSSRPEHLQIGTLAGEMVRACQEVATRDPTTASAFTINLTFVPANYCIYGSIPDLLMPDSYPISHAQPLTNFRNYTAMARRASAPKPYTMVYQGCWEEWAHPQDEWKGRQALLDAGWEPFVDTTRKRGFGRAPTPEEISIQILYAIGNGSKGALSYTDATEVGQGWVFHGSKELPEIWDAITKNSRSIRLLEPVIENGFPMNWAKVNSKNLWISTVTSTESAALVTVVNEDHRSDETGFLVKAARKVKITFPDLPWFKPRFVFRVAGEELQPLGASRGVSGLEWQEDLINEGSIYLLVASADQADTLLNHYHQKPPQATEEGKKRLNESYLNGRRKTLSLP